MLPYSVNERDISWYLLPFGDSRVPAIRLFGGKDDGDDHCKQGVNHNKSINEGASRQTIRDTSKLERKYITDKV